MAVWIACTIGAWSHTEAKLRNALTGMLSADAVPVAAMYARIDSAAARSAALDGAASAALDEQDQRLFRATFVVLRRLNRARDEFSHWIWGYSDDLPDALMLLDPRDEIQHQAKPPDVRTFDTFFRNNIEASRDHSNEALDRLVREWAMQTRIDPKLVRVYRQSDMKKAYTDAKRAEWLATNLHLLVGRISPELTERARDLLGSAPEIRQELGRGSEQRPLLHEGTNHCGIDVAKVVLAHSKRRHQTFGARTSVRFDRERRGQCSCVVFDGRISLRLFALWVPVSH